MAGRCFGWAVQSVDQIRRAEDSPHHARKIVASIEQRSGCGSMAGPGLRTHLRSRSMRRSRVAGPSRPTRPPSHCGWPGSSRGVTPGGRRKRVSTTACNGLGGSARARRQLERLARSPQRPPLPYARHAAETLGEQRPSLLISAAHRSGSARPQDEQGLIEVILRPVGQVTPHRPVRYSRPRFGCAHLHVWPATASLELITHCRTQRGLALDVSRPWCVMATSSS
jgi:hypothetical protein